MILQSDEAIVLEIDTTIDRLLENSEALKKIACNSLYQEEAFALEKTQESLIAHLIHMDNLLKKKADDVYKPKEALSQKQVHAKLGRSGYLNHLSECKEKATIVEEPSYRKPKIHKRKVLITKKS
ncbi:MAG: hypothetical protein FJZ63_04940 [Chlamydiae bacterium]|nr:hypothetical protein [Chlamydiota bacterium]